MSQLPLVEAPFPPVRFSSAVNGHLGTDEREGPHTQQHARTLGKVVHEGGIAVLAKGCSLEIVSVPSNERLAAATFATDAQDGEIEVTCIHPFSTDPSSSTPTHVLVGIDSTLQGLLVVFDIQECRVVRCLGLPNRIASLALVSPSGGPSIPPYLHPSLLYYHGIIACGLQEGHLFLIDLALDMQGEGIESSMEKPGGLYFISPGSRDPARLRTKAAGEGTHLTIDIAPFARGQQFIWDDVSFPMDAVQVTALHYAPQLASLAVGFNTGTWALISLVTLTPDYTSPFVPDTSPVTQLCWQEPLDDPRNYCYYWVVRGDGRTPAVASLYGLGYQDRQWDSVAGPMYSRLDTVTTRWIHVLGDPNDEDQNATFSSQVVAITALELPLGDRQEVSDLDQQVMDLGLVLIAWSLENVTFLGVFDINCWYQDQMPSSCEPGALCPYFSISALPLDASELLDLAVHINTIAKFGSTGSQVEQHFQPSSLRFSLTALLPTGWLEASHLGLQRKILAELGKPGSLVSPTHLYQFCIHAGLSVGPFDPSLLSQRRALLSVLLEHSMVGSIVAAAREWSDGSLVKAGCTLRFLLDWAWGRVAGIKEQIDRQTLPLFDFSIQEIEGGRRGELASLAGQLAQLVTILSSLASLAPVTSTAGLEELEVRLSVTGLVLLYTQAISWFASVGLLPEQPDGPRSPFPVSRLEAQYREKRLRLAESTGVYGRPRLMVDALCDDIGPELVTNFQRAGGTGCYPPPSLHALITTFLSESSAPSKLRLVQYFFLDLAHASPPDQINHLVDNLVKFPSAFSLPPSLIKLTQAFWLLDHEDWEEGVSMMLDPLLQDDHLSGSHHRAILTALLAQSQPALALRYTRMRRPPLQQAEDVTLHISVLLANGAIQEAFTFQRSRRGSVSSSALLSSFYKTAEELGKLDSVLQLSLSQAEEREFVSFLESASKAHAREVLLMYYLQRARFSEAMQLNQEMAEAGIGGTARQAIMARYSHILPTFASTLGKKRLALAPSTKQEKPVPLSVVLQDRNIRLQSHATLIEQRLHTPKRDANSNNNIFTPFRKKKAGGLSVSGLLRPTDVSTSSKRPRIGEKSLIGFPQESTNIMEDSRVLEDNDEGTITPPTKRTRLCDVSTLNMSVKSMRRMSVYKTADALTILSTPTVTRRLRPLSPRRPPSTPQSILKVKQLIQDSVTKSTVAEKPFLDVSLNLEDTGTLTPSRSREGTPGKSLRFKEPKRLPAPGTPPPPPPLEGAMVVVAEAVGVGQSLLSNESQESFHSLGEPELVQEVDDDEEEPMEGVEESYREKAEEEEREVLEVDVEGVSADRRPMPRQTSTAAKLDEIVERGSKTLREKENEALLRAAKAAKEVQAQEEARRKKSDNEEKQSDDDVVEVLDDEEDQDQRGALDEEEEYYANRKWRKRECDIVVTLDDEEKTQESSQDEEKVLEMEEEVVDLDSAEESPEGKQVLDYSWAPSRHENRKSVRQIVQEEEEEEEEEEKTVGDDPKEEKELSEREPVGKKKISRSSLDTTASNPSFYEPINFSWEEQKEDKSKGKTTEEILLEIEDGESGEEEQEDQGEEDVIDIDSDEGDGEEAVEEKSKEKQVVATQVLFSSFDNREEAQDGEVSDAPIEFVVEEPVVVEEEESPKMPPGPPIKAASTSLLLFSTFGTQESEETAKDGEEVEDKVASEEVGRNDGDVDEEYEIKDHREKEEQMEDEGQLEETGDERVVEVVEDQDDEEEEEDVEDQEEEEEAVEVLDSVSTAATRASSIAGSVLGEHVPPSALAGEVQGELEDKLAGEEEIMASSVPFLPLPSSSGLATFAFAEPTGAATDSDDEQVRPDSKLCFDFSLPVDKSQLEELESEKDDEEVAKNSATEENEKDAEEGDGGAEKKVEAKFAASQILRPSSGIFQLVHDQEETTEDSSGDEADDDEEEGDDEEEEDEVDQALDFSWTKVAPKKVELSDLVGEEKNVFTSPTVISKEVLEVQDEGQDQFQFGVPHNESTLSEKENEEIEKETLSAAAAESTEEEDEEPPKKKALNRRASTSPLGRSTSKPRSPSSTDKRGGAAAGTPPSSVKRRSARASSPISEQQTPSRRSTRKRSGGSPATPSVQAKSRTSSLSSPATATSTAPVERSPVTETRSSKRKNLSSTSDSSPTLARNSKKRSRSSPNTSSTHPISTRKSARGQVPVEHVVDAKQVEKDQQASLVRAETLPMDVGASELEIAADVDTREDGNIVRREGSAASTIIMESSLGKVSAASTEVMEDLEEEKEGDVASEAMETSVSRPRKSKVSSDLTKLAIETSASPRRSRRASGLAPATERYDTLELRNRTVTEIYSPLAKLGRAATEGNTTLDTSRRSRTRSGLVTTKEKEAQESVKMEEELEKEDSINLTVVELREELKSRGLSAAGNKADLRRRLLDSQVDSETIQPESPAKSTTTTSKLAETPTKKTPNYTLITPGKKGKKAAVSEDESLPVTPSRRSRRLSGSLDLDTGAPTTPSRRVRQSSLSEAPLTPSAAPLTPSRRSRRLSGVEPDHLEIAPDGGLIQRKTPSRRTPSTPRARRHTSVKASDVQEALNLATSTPAALPIVVEEEEEAMEAESASTSRKRSSTRRSMEAVIDVDMEKKSSSPKGKRKTIASTVFEGVEEKVHQSPKKMTRREQKRSLASQATQAQLSEEDEVSIVDEVPATSIAKAKPSTRGVKSLGQAQKTEPAYKSRRKTITTLGAVDVVPSLPEDELTESGQKRLSEMKKTKKKYIPVKKKTSVRIN